MEEHIISASDNIYINDLTEKISHIIKSPNKNEFIKEYNECHNQIKQIDEILGLAHT